MLLVQIGGANLESSACFSVHSDPCSLQVGMRYFHLNKNKYHSPIINLDKLWTLVGEEVGRPKHHLAVLPSPLV